MKSLLLALLLVLPAQAAAQDDAPVAWVQAAADGYEARLLTGAAACPVLHTDHGDVAMAVRAPADADFALLCAAKLPTGITTAAIAGIPLPLPVADPSRILVVGDSGCRIKGSVVQDCRQWRFPQIAASAARLHPDLVIHVGDYVSRESPCPAAHAGCAGSPYGDNGPAWRADFFDPAAPLLKAAPIVLVRGNHEECARQGAGWLRLMGPSSYDPAQPCISHLPLFTVDLGRLRLAVLDDSGAPDRAINHADLPAYTADLKALAAIAPPVWLVLHRPIWGAISGPLDIPIGGNLTMVQAVHDAAKAQGPDAPLLPPNVTLQLSGHIHAFEALNYDRAVPPQIVAGIGGDLLHDTPKNLWGAVFQGPETVRVPKGISHHGFGFVLLTAVADGWTVALFDPAGNPVRQCHFHPAAEQVDCPPPQTAP